MRRALIWAASSLLIPFFVVGYAIFFVLLAIAMVASSPIDAIAQWFDSTSTFADSHRKPADGKPADKIS